MCTCILHIIVKDVCNCFFPYHQSPNLSATCLLKETEIASESLQTITMQTEPTFEENLVDNQKCQAGFRPLCKKIPFPKSTVNKH